MKMNRINQLLKKPLSQILIIVPVFNMLLSVYYFLYAKTSVKYFLWAVPLASTSSWLIFRLIPNSSVWLLYYAFFVFLSFIQSIKTHGADLGTGKPSKKDYWFLLFRF